jgi:3-oxoacyl-[acyl-carrier-protein] synthase II
MPESSSAPVAVTGLGCICPLGNTPESAYSAYARGETGIHLLTQPWAESLRSRLGGLVSLDVVSELGDYMLSRLDRYSQLALLASRQAWQASGLSASGLALDRLAVVMATGIGGFNTMLDQHHRLISGAKRLHPLGIAMAMPNAATAQISMEIGACGGAHAPVSACAGGAEAIAWGLMLLEARKVDAVLVGGAESMIHALAIRGFSEMRALSSRLDDPASACRPFAADREGFVLSEGAGAIVLERLEDARARHADVQALLLGAGMTSDAHHLATPHPEGMHAARAITLALQDAGLVPQDVDFVSAHATGTRIGDLAEARAIETVFGAYSDHLWVTAPKGGLGHLLGGAGAVESILTIKALQAGVVPASVNAIPIDPEIRLNIPTSSEPHLAHRSERYAIKNTFGFGGHNVSLVWASV